MPGGGPAAALSEEEKQARRLLAVQKLARVFESGSASANSCPDKSGGSESELDFLHALAEQLAAAAAAAAEGTAAGQLGARLEELQSSIGARLRQAEAAAAAGSRDSAADAGRRYEQLRKGKAGGGAEGYGAASASSGDAVGSVTSNLMRLVRLHSPANLRADGQEAGGEASAPGDDDARLFDPAYWLALLTPAQREAWSLRAAVEPTREARAANASIESPADLPRLRAELASRAYVLRVFPLCALVPRVQGSSGAAATVQFVCRSHAKTPTTRAGPWPDFALRLE